MLNETKHSGMTYSELMQAANTAKAGKDARRIHKELKKYGDGLPFGDRYPVLIQIGIVVFDVTVSIALSLLVLKFVAVI